MKIVVVSRKLPKVSGYGVQMRLYKHLQGLQAYGEVMLLLLHEATDDFDLPEGCSARVSGLPAAELKPRLGVWAPPENARPVTVAETAWLLEFVSAQGCDLFFCFRLEAARTLEAKAAARCLQKAVKVLDLDDMESKAAWRAVKANYRVYGKVFTLRRLLEALQLRRIEKRLFKLLDLCLVCSDADRHELEIFNPGCSFHVLPNTLGPITQLPMQEPGKVVNILFVGGMGYHPNVRAVEYFVAAVFPAIKKLSQRRCHLYVVGYNPPARIRALNERDDITVTGGVASLEPYYSDANVVVCPILSGGGTRIKIIEAMAYGRPVVSTTIGAEGLGVCNGDNILLADSPMAFADAVVTVAGDSRKSGDLIAAGRRLYETAYSRSALDRAYRALAERF